MAAKAPFEAIAQQAMEIWKNALYFFKVPSVPEVTIPFSGTLLNSQALGGVMDSITPHFKTKNLSQSVPDHPHSLLFKKVHNTFLNKHPKVRLSLFGLD